MIKRPLGRIPEIVVACLALPSTNPVGVSWFGSLRGGTKLAGSRGGKRQEGGGKRGEEAGWGVSACVWAAKEPLVYLFEAHPVRRCRVENTEIWFQDAERGVLFGKFNK